MPRGHDQSGPTNLRYDPTLPLAAKPSFVIVVFVPAKCAAAQSGIVAFVAFVVFERWRIG